MADNKSGKSFYLSADQIVKRIDSNEGSGVLVLDTEWEEPSE
ncbi:hypothetical protein [Paenibacillus sp. FSL K6-1230]